MTSRPPIANPPLWSLFDREWYLRRYKLSESEYSYPYEHYINNVKNSKLSPNPYFDEAWYLECNPDVAEAVLKGEFRSGLDHFSQYGYEYLSPNCFFDIDFYKSENEISDDLNKKFYSDLYDFFLKNGQFAKQKCHKLLDPNYVAYSNSGNVGYFETVCRSAHSGVNYNIFFDATWYYSFYSTCSAALDKFEVFSSFEYYVKYGQHLGHSPSVEFDESFYLKKNPEVAAVVNRDGFSSGFEHYFLYGQFERRAPSDYFDPDYYASQLPNSITDFLGEKISWHEHYLRSGSQNYAPVRPFRLKHVPESDGKIIFSRQAYLCSTNLISAALDFTYKDEPVVSVIIICLNNFDLTIQTLTSLRASTTLPLQVIVVDNASTDDVRYLDVFVEGLEIIRNETNVGFLEACNQALIRVRGKTTLFLNNDVTLGIRSIDIALSRIFSEASIGAVGGKIVRSHGLLQEAGCIIWNDGTTLGYGRDDEPDRPEYNFVREVDYCSGAFLLVKTDLLRELDGFSSDYAPAYYEETDLCVRIQTAGYSVVYDPSVVINHIEYGSQKNPAKAISLMKRNEKIFKRRNADYISGKYTPCVQNILLARSSKKDRKKILFIEDYIPHRRLGAGFVRANDIVHALSELEVSVSVLPINGYRDHTAGLRFDFDDDVELLWNKTYLDLEEHLSERRNYYDAVWMSRTHNLDKTAHIFDKFGKQLPIILDTEAVATNRHAAFLALERKVEPQQFAAMIQTEFKNSSLASAMVAVNEQEQELLRIVTKSPVLVLGHEVATIKSTPKFEERNNILFLGSFHAVNHPNYDSVEWFLKNVWPNLNGKLGGAEFLIAGYATEEVKDKLKSLPDGARFVGEVRSVREVYDAAKVFVAPTRYAAGIPFKIHEATAHGVPCVVSSLLASQLGWSDGAELSVGDLNNPQTFIDRIYKLYTDQNFWSKIRHNAWSTLDKHNSHENYIQSVGEILRSVA